jgi:ABC-type transport system involved in multi-copper enzyme maturation permease subunit
MSTIRLPRPSRLRGLSEVRHGIVAVGVKELRGRMRGKRAFILLTIYLLILGGFTWMMAMLQERTIAIGFGDAFFEAARVGRELFIALLLLQTFLVLVMAPAATASAISLEREKQTLDMLATTPISSLAIVLGKLLSALTFVFLLILASIPLTSIVFMFGGVSPDDVVRGYGVLLVTAIGLGSVGLFASALVKRTQAATVLTYLVVVAMTLGASFLFVFWMVMSGWNQFERPAAGDGFLDNALRRPPEALLYFNPFVAQVDVICGTETGFGGSCELINQVTDRRVNAWDLPQPGIEGGAPGFAPDVMPQQQFMVRDAYWPRSLAAWIVLSLVLVVLSVQLVSPTRRWRFRLPRPRRRPTGSSA